VTPVRSPTSRRLWWKVIPPITYFAAYALVTWPWVLHLWAKAPSSIDVSMFVWDFWWMRHAIETLQWPFHTEHAMAPMGGSMAFQGMHLTAFVSVPIQHVVGTATAYNLLAVAVVVGAGCAMYALARDMHIDRIPALFCGLLLVASPHLAFRYGESGHMNLAHVLWIPVALLAVRVYLRDPTVWRGMLVGAALAGSFLSDLTITIFAMSLVTAYLAGLLVYRWRTVLGAIRVVPVLAGIATFLVLSAPLIIELASVLSGPGVPNPRGLGSSEISGNDPTALLIPNLRREGFGHLGIAATILATLGLVLYARGRPLMVWAAIVVVGCVVLSMGVHLVIGDARFVPVPITILESPTEVSALMPFTWVQSVLPHLRNPMRFMLLGAVPLALLAGFALHFLLRDHYRLGIALALVLVPVSLLDARNPIDTSMVSALSPAHRPVVAEPDQSAIVVDVPLGFRTGYDLYGWQDGPPLVWATLHEHPVAVGFFARMARPELQKRVFVPLYRDLMALQDRPVDAPPPEVLNAAEGRASALEGNMKYVVVQRRIRGFPLVVDYLAAAGFQLVAEDPEMVTYQLQGR